MKKILFLLLLASASAMAQFTPTTNVNYVKFLKTPPTGVTSDFLLMYNDSDKFMYRLPSSNLLDLATLERVLTNGDTADNLSIILNQSGDNITNVVNPGFYNLTFEGSDAVLISHNSGEGYLSLFRSSTDASELLPHVGTGVFSNNLPSASGTLAVSVNGTAADASGDITIAVGTGTVESVTGSIVDNTDPNNPIIDIPTLSQVTGEGNTTATNIVVSSGTSSTTVAPADILAINSSTSQYTGLLSTALVLSTNTGSKGLLMKNDNMTDSYTTQAPDLATGTYYNVFPDAAIGSAYQSVVTNQSASSTTYDYRYRDGLVTTTTVSTINSVSQQILYSVQIPANTFLSNTILDLDALWTRVGAAANATINVYLNDTNDLTTPIAIGQMVSTGAQVFNGFHRSYKLTGTHIRGLNGTSTATNDFMTSTAAVLNGDYVLSSPIYFIVAVSLGNGADVITQEYLRLRVNK